MTPLLRFDGVALRRGGRLLFEDLDLALGPGEALQVTGPNGSGKSSLIRLAAGLLRAGARAASSGRRWRSPMTSWRSTASCRSGARSASGAGLAERRWRRSALPTSRQVPVRLLSSGQLKRATLARVAASGAPLWLLDEPLNALDGDGAERLGRA